MALRTWKPLLAAVICIATAAPLAYAAQYGRTRPEIRRQSSDNTYDRGYRDGLRQGETDARTGRPFGGTLFSDRRDYGNGFIDGYRTGYDRQSAIAASRGRYDARVVQQQRPNVRGYREPAFAAGFDNGYEKGVSDGRDGDRYDPVRHRDYRDAERGYRDNYGSKDAYRTNFRAGFRQGYEEGYRSGARNRE